MTDDLISKGIENFLNYIHEAEQLYKMSISEELEANAETQDILHSLELEEHNYHNTARLAVKLKEVRRMRREAKNLVATTTPVVEWIKNNRNVINSLEQLLGKVRKEERTIRDRFYTPRTEAVKNALGEKK